MAFWHTLLVPDENQPAAVPWSLLGAIALISIAVRLVYLIIFPIEASDALAADRWGVIAQNVASGNGYVYPDPAYDSKMVPNVERLPVPVLFFAAIFWLFGHVPYPVWIVNWLMEAVTVVLTYLIAYKVFGSQRVGLVSSFLLAVFIPAAEHTRLLLSVSIYTLLTAAFVFYFMEAIRRRSTNRIALAGLLLGLASMCQPGLLAFPAYCLLLLFYYLRNLRTVARYFVIFCALFLVAPTPWIVRNYLEFGTFVPSTSMLGFNLYRNNCRLDDDNWIRLPGHDEQVEMVRELYADAGLVMNEQSPIAVDRFQRELALEKIRQRPDRFLAGCGYRFVRLWFNLGWGTPASWRSYLIAALDGAVLLAACAAFVFFRGRWMHRSWLLVALIVHHVVLYTLINANVRYLMPYMPYLLIFSAHAILSVIDRVRRTADSERA